jgi:hypothetical protein
MIIKYRVNKSFTIVNITGVSKEPITADYDKFGNFVVAKYIRGHQKYTVPATHWRILNRLHALGWAKAPRNRLTATEGL